MRLRQTVFFFFLAVIAALPSIAAEIKSGAFQGRPAIVLSNDKLQLQVLELGGAFAALTMANDANPVNPLWDSITQDRLSGKKERSSGSIGHFVCVDGFGPASAEEREAGLSGHGEAHSLPWLVLEKKEGGEAALKQTVHLPIVQEVYTRTLRLRQGENVVSVEAELESLLGFDRPINWAEHATIGPPFLTPGETVVDISPNKALTRPHRAGKSARPHRLVSGQEFVWPNAPTVDGKAVDIRAMPMKPNSGDHTAHRFDPDRKHAWVTALHKPTGLLLGYIFPREHYPWLQTWENFPTDAAQSARGLEFGTQAFDLPRREVITQNRLMGELLYRWLPAKSAIPARYWMFWTKTPGKFEGISSVELRDGKIEIKGAGAGQSVSLACASCR